MEITDQEIREQAKAASRAARKAVWDRGGTAVEANREGMRAYMRIIYRIPAVSIAHAVRCAGRKRRGRMPSIVHAGRMLSDTFEMFSEPMRHAYADFLLVWPHHGDAVSQVVRSHTGSLDTTWLAHYASREHGGEW